MANAAALAPMMSNLIERVISNYPSLSPSAGALDASGYDFATPAFYPGKPASPERKSVEVEIRSFRRCA